MAPPRPWPLLSTSLHYFRSRPVAMTALGGAVVVSLISVCCGIGLLAAPWFACELFALQMGESLGRPVERSRSWIAASFILVGAVLLVSSVAWLTMLGLGSGIVVEGPPRPPTWEELLRGGGAVAAVCSAAAVSFALPFLYAPFILIERKAGLGAAILESAWLVSSGGKLAHLGLSITANALQVLPAAVAALVTTLIIDSAVAPLAALVSLPLLAVTVPLGQGMVAAAYMERRGELPAAVETPAEGRIPTIVVVTWVSLIGVPMLCIAMLGACLLIPSTVAPGRAQGGIEVGSAVVSQGQAPTIYPPRTAIAIEVSADAVRVIASDGGGAGRLPLPELHPVDRVRVVRMRDVYGVEVHQAGATRLTWIDRAGVRLDDNLRVRLFDHVGEAGLAVILISVLATAMVMLPVLSSLARVRRMYLLRPEIRPGGAELEALRARSLRLSWLAAAGLAPLAVAALYFGLASLGL